MKSMRRSSCVTHCGSRPPRRLARATGEYGTPLACARPRAGRSRVPAADHSPARLRSALCRQGVAPSGGADGHRGVWRRLRRRHQRRGGPGAIAGDSDGPLHLHHPIKKAADIEHAYRPGSARSSSTIRARRRSSPVCPAISRSWSAGVSTIRSAKSDLSTKFGVDPADAELVVKHVLAAGVGFAGFSFHVGSQGSSVAALPHRAAHDGRPRPPYAAQPRRVGDDDRHRRRVPGRLTARRCRRSASIADVIDDVLGPDHEFTVLAEPGRYPGRPLHDAAHQRRRHRDARRTGCGTTWTTASTAATPTSSPRMCTRRSWRCCELTPSPDAPIRARHAGRADVRQRRRHRP